MKSPYVWYTRDVSPGSPDLIHQTLALGTLADIKRLQLTVGKDQIKTVFRTYPKKIYRPETLYFITRFVLQLPHPVDEKLYLTTTPRRIR